MVEGLTRKNIAYRLFVSPSTILTHSRNIYSKLHVHTRGGAVAKALRERLVSVRSPTLPTNRSSPPATRITWPSAHAAPPDSRSGERNVTSSPAKYYKRRIVGRPAPV